MVPALVILILSDKHCNGCIPCWGAQEKEPLAVPRPGREGFPEEVVFGLECEDQHLCRAEKGDRQGGNIFADKKGSLLGPSRHS